MNWILRNARISDNTPLQDVLIVNGKIDQVGANLPHLPEQEAGQKHVQEWDLAGRVLLPGFIDIHTHLDKTYSSIENQSGTLLEAIELWTVLKEKRTFDDVRAAMRRALDNAISHGVTGIRSHINADNGSDLTKVEAAITLREEMAGSIDLQLVALGWYGVTPESDAYMEEGLRMGLDYIGGAPHLGEAPEASVDAIFRLAERIGKPIDLHIDETEDPNMLLLEHVADQTMAYGMQGLVTAGHCCSLAFVDQTTADRVMDKVAAAQINIVTLPSCNLVLMGRQMNPVPRGVTRIKELLARGVNVCAASDNVHDPFNPFGSYDLLQIANLNAHVAHMTGEPELRASLAMVTENPAKAWGIDTRGIVPGAPADLAVVDAYNLLDTIVSTPARLGTFKAGKLVVRTQIERTWY